MTHIHGFELLKEQHIRELDIHAYLYKHVKTGAELLSVKADDENKVFGIVFRTPPADSTGIAHILEHSVLCGSRKYPVKEPFVELLKGSLNTFLNAFTYPDKTCYPVASQNLQDFYNLVDVYVDAVFYPRLTPRVLQQEGWHYEKDDMNNGLKFKGVVYNEMKGNYSSPESLLSEYSQQSLFPDNTYGLDSGGHPRHIPDLTFEKFSDFHRKYYHPSNARIYFYGDDDPIRRLQFMDNILKDFDRINIDSGIRLQAPFSEPRRIIKPFTVDEENTEAKGMMTLNWLLPETNEIVTNYALRILSCILVGMTASPLRKALIDSGLGDDLAGGGLENELRQMSFSVGLKGIDIKNADAIETLIMDTLENFVREGIDPLTIEAALNTIEFRLRENNSGSFPKGLSLMLRSLTTWLYDNDPFDMMSFKGPLETIKAGFKADSSMFGQMISRYFINNTHRTTVILTPDTGLGKEESAEEKNRLDYIQQGMSSTELQKLIENAEELKRIQSTPDSLQALATIPFLTLGDLDKNIRTIPFSIKENNGSRLISHDIFTNGIVYLNVGFDLHVLPEFYLPYIPLFGRCLVEMGTRRQDYVSLSKYISRKTGGIGPNVFLSPVTGSDQSATLLFLTGKAVANKAEELFNIMREVFLDLELDNKDRFRQILMEEKSRQEHKIIPSGHMTVKTRLQSHFSEASWVAEQMHGVSYLFFLRKLVEAVDNDWKGVYEILAGIHEKILNRNAMIINITADEKGLASVEPYCSSLTDSLPGMDVVNAVWQRESVPFHEGFIAPSQINYVGKGLNLYESGYSFHGSSLVITRYLRNSYLWDRVRVQGGAYGAFCMLDRLSGGLTLVSYRDPNLTGTLDVFDDSARFLIEHHIDDDELTKSIIGTIGDLDAYMLPDAKGYVSMSRYFIGDSDETRQKIRDEVLSTKKEDFRIFGKALMNIRDNGIVKVLGNQAAIEAGTKDKPGWLNILKVI